MKTSKFAIIGILNLILGCGAKQTFAHSSTVESIVVLADQSSCIHHAWKGRGVAPKGYIEGITLSYARSLCRLKLNASLSTILGSSSSGNPSKDALDYYESKFNDLSISIHESGTEPLRAIYTLGIGLGMRESSGSYCEGWDRSAGSNRPSSAAESGVFQTSYDSMILSPELSKLYEEYKSNPQLCFLDIYKQGVKCKSPNILGTGEGAEYQKFNISCPAFATEYAMTMLRISRKHYGPINRKETQIYPGCADLLKNVQDLIESNLNICNSI